MLYYFYYYHYCCSSSTLNCAQTETNTQISAMPLPIRSIFHNRRVFVCVNSLSPFVPQLKWWQSARDISSLLCVSFFLPFVFSTLPHSLRCLPFCNHAFKLIPIFAATRCCLVFTFYPFVIPPGLLALCLFLSLSLQLCTALGNEMTCQACIFPHPNLTSTRFANLLVVANAHIARTHPQ